MIQIRLHKGLGTIVCSHLVGITKDHRGAELMLFMQFVNNKFNLVFSFRVDQSCPSRICQYIIIYSKVVSSITSRLEAHDGFFRLVMHKLNNSIT